MCILSLRSLIHVDTRSRAIESYGWSFVTSQRCQPFTFRHVCAPGYILLDRYILGVHNNDAIMSTMTSKIICVTIVCSTVASGPDQRKHQSPASLAFVQGTHRWPVNSPHKEPVTRKCFHFMTSSCYRIDFIYLTMKECIRQPMGMFQDTYMSQCIRRISHTNRPQTRCMGYQRSVHIPAKDFARKKNCLIVWIIFIFDRCYHRWAVTTPVKKKW